MTQPLFDACVELQKAKRVLDWGEDINREVKMRRAWDAFHVALNKEINEKAKKNSET